MANQTATCYACLMFAVVAASVTAHAADPAYVIAAYQAGKMGKSHFMAAIDRLGSSASGLLVEALQSNENPEQCACLIRAIGRCEAKQGVDAISRAMALKGASGDQLGVARMGKKVLTIRASYVDSKGDPE